MPSALQATGFYLECGLGNVWKCSAFSVWNPWRCWHVTPLKSFDDLWRAVWFDPNLWLSAECFKRSLVFSKWFLSQCWRQICYNDKILRFPNVFKCWQALPWNAWKCWDFFSVKCLNSRVEIGQSSHFQHAWTFWSIVDLWEHDIKVIVLWLDLCPFAEPTTAEPTTGMLVHGSCYILV